MTTADRIFDTRGPVVLPSLEEIQRDAQRQIVHTAVLDANVCLDIATFVRGKVVPHIHKQVVELLTALDEAGVDVMPAFWRPGTRIAEVAPRAQLKFSLNPQRSDAVHL